MGIQQAKHISEHHDVSNDPASKVSRAKSCMAIIWVQNGTVELDKATLVAAVKQMTGVSGASFTREKPAILMIEYCTKDTRAVELVAGINSLGAYAKIVGC